MSHGTEKIIRLIKKRDFRLKRNLTYSPIIGCSLTLGFGGSAGAEGPIAYSGAAIGSNIGQAFGVSMWRGRRYLRHLQSPHRRHAVCAGGT